MITLTLFLAIAGAAHAAPAPPSGHTHFTLTSPAFAAGAVIPDQFTCQGANLSPPLHWSGTPAGTRSFALTLDDPDAPSGDWTHWVLYNIPASVAGLPEHVPTVSTLPDGTCQGRNSFHEVGYDGPCPPPGRPHHYIFRLYALDATLHLPAPATKARLQHAMTGHILARAALVGTAARLP